MLFGAILFSNLVYPEASAKEFELPSFAYVFLENHCLDCHDAFEQKGDLNLEELAFNLEDGQIFEKWVLVHDRANHGEMPPEKRQRPDPEDLDRFLESIGKPLLKADRKRVANSGRPRCVA